MEDFSAAHVPPMIIRQDDHSAAFGTVSDPLRAADT
jgi:hypothetical protein